MRKTIEITTLGNGSVTVEAVVYGHFAIHREHGYFEKKTGKPLFALTHVPSGLQIDGHYKNPLCLRASLRFLASRNWPESTEEIRNSPQCKLDAIQAAELGIRKHELPTASFACDHNASNLAMCSADSLSQAASQRFQLWIAGL